MKIRNLFIIGIVITMSYLITGCNLKDDYIIKVSENTDEKPSGDKVDEIFESEKISELMDKLKTTPSEVSEKLDEVDNDTQEILDELNDKIDELKTTIDNADFENKSEDIVNKINDINDKIDEIKEKTDDAKDRLDNFENPVDEEKVNDLIDELKLHMSNLENSINRLGK